MTHQSQRGLVGATLRPDPARRAESQSSLDRTACDKGSPGVIWSSCLVVSFTLASLCSFVTAGHDQPRSASPRVAGAGQATAPLTAGQDDRPTPAKPQVPPAEILKYQPPPDGTWMADAEVSDAQKITARPSRNPRSINRLLPRVD
jgi:hypothetical protein